MVVSIVVALVVGSLVASDLLMRKECEQLTPVKARLRSRQEMMRARERDEAAMR